MIRHARAALCVLVLAAPSAVHAEETKVLNLTLGDAAPPPFEELTFRATRDEFRGDTFDTTMVVAGDGTVRLSGTLPSVNGLRLSPELLTDLKLTPAQLERLTAAIQEANVAAVTTRDGPRVPLAGYSLELDLALKQAGATTSLSRLDNARDFLKVKHLVDVLSADLYSLIQTSPAFEKFGGAKVPARHSSIVNRPIMELYRDQRLTADTTNTVTAEKAFQEQRAARTRRLDPQPPTSDGFLGAMGR